MKGFFITATDTDAGKTFVTTGLLQSLSQKGYKTLGFKPVASGCQKSEQGLQNEDALQLIKASNVALDYSLINPYAFEPAIAPHLAAQDAGITIDLAVIAETIERYKNKADYVLVEGVGGWLVPLNEQETVADLARQLAFPIIVVVNMRLGCINHALLTVQAIEQLGLPMAGWIANQAHTTSLTPMLQLEDNIRTLKARIKAPLLGVVPDLSTIDAQQNTPLSDFVDLGKCN